MGFWKKMRERYFTLGFMTLVFWITIHAALEHKWLATSLGLAIAFTEVIYEAKPKD